MRFVVILIAVLMAYNIVSDDEIEQAIDADSQPIHNAVKKSDAKAPPSHNTFKSTSNNVTQDNHPVSSVIFITVLNKRTLKKYTFLVVDGLEIRCESLRIVVTYQNVKCTTPGLLLPCLTTSIKMCIFCDADGDLERELYSGWFFPDAPDLGYICHEVYDVFLSSPSRFL